MQQAVWAQFASIFALHHWFSGSLPHSCHANTGSGFCAARRLPLPTRYRHTLAGPTSPGLAAVRVAGHGLERRVVNSGAGAIAPLEPYP